MLSAQRAQGVHSTVAGKLYPYGYLTEQAIGCIVHMYQKQSSDRYVFNKG